MDRTLMPMGEASISFTWAMPSAVMLFTCAGKCSPFNFASSPGIRLSNTIVVFPDPDTPVTTVSRPLGMSISRDFTVWIASVDRWSFPSSNMSSRAMGLSDTHIRSLRQKRTDHGLLFGDYLWNRTLCDHIAASGTGFRSHLDQPVRFG